MTELVYSLEARNILNRFHSVDKIVYVEGEDDIRFWELLFEKLTEIKVRVEESGGKNNLRSRMEEIKNGTANFFVAIDSDFDVIMELDQHPQVLRTFGYSMENTIVSDAVLQRLICSVAKTSKHLVPIADCAHWLEELDSTIQPLVLADAANRIKCLGKAVIGDNCDRFLKSEKSSNLCSEKITSHLASLSIDIEKDIEDRIVEAMNKQGIQWLDLIRGHFLLTSAFRFVKECISKLGYSISISREMFFGGLMLAFDASFNQHHRHYEHYYTSLHHASIKG